VRVFRKHTEKCLFLQFADGVYLVLLMGLLEGYFVPLHSFFLTPDSFEQKVMRFHFSLQNETNKTKQKQNKQTKKTPKQTYFLVLGMLLTFLYGFSVDS